MNTQISIKDLSKFLSSVAIPKPSDVNNKTFISQIWTGKKEKFISDFYAFFFNPNEIHGFRDLFLQTLIDFINPKDIDLDYDTITVDREYVIQDGRIDILIHSTDNWAIIIENKIDANIYNDLQNYLNQIKAEQKFVIVFSQVQEKIKDEFAINITHKDFCLKINNNIGNYFLQAKPFYIQLLQEFCKTLINMNAKDENVLKFYFENKEKIVQINNVIEYTKSYITEQIKQIPQLLEINLIPSDSYVDSYFYLKSVKKTSLVFTIAFADSISNPGEYQIIIVLQKDYVEKAPELERKFASNYPNLDFLTNQKKSWVHFAFKRYKLDEETFLNLSENIAKNIKQDGFLELFNKLEEIL